MCILPADWVTEHNMWPKLRPWLMVISPKFKYLNSYHLLNIETCCPWSANYELPLLCRTYILKKMSQVFWFRLKNGILIIKKKHLDHFENRWKDNQSRSLRKNIKFKIFTYQGNLIILQVSNSGHDEKKYSNLNTH